MSAGLAKTDRIRERLRSFCTLLCAVAYSTDALTSARVRLRLTWPSVMRFRRVSSGGRCPMPASVGLLSMRRCFEGELIGCLSWGARALAVSFSMQLSSIAGVGTSVLTWTAFSSSYESMLASSSKSSVAWRSFAWPSVGSSNTAVATVWGGSGRTFLPSTRSWPLLLL